MINGKKKASLSRSDHIKIIYVIILQINKRLEVQQMINEIEKKERLRYENNRNLIEIVQQTILNQKADKQDRKEGISQKGPTILIECKK